MQLLTILSELNRRFSANNIDLFNSLDGFNPQSPHFLNFSLISSFASLYGIASDDYLITECRLATRTFSTKELLSVSSVYTDLLQLQAAFPTLKKLFQIALTLVVSTAHCERSFSAPARIKTHRTAMTNHRLADISLISIESDLCSDPSFLEETVHRFDSTDKNRTIMLS